jgi:RNA-directed DNA polymerase
MTKTSIGVQDWRPRIGQTAQAEPRPRIWGLDTHGWQRDVVEAASQRAKQHHRASGVDGVTCAAIEAQGRQVFLPQRSDARRTKPDRPGPCRHVALPQRGGGPHGLTIPAIRDRVGQGARCRITAPIVEADVQEGSCGYRPRRTAHQARERVRRGRHAGRHTSSDMDLQRYVDTVRPDRR